MGLNLKDKTEIINNMLIEIVGNTDDVTDVNVGSVLRFLVEALGLELADIYDELKNIYDGTRIDTASGEDLENLGNLLGITRKQGTKSSGNVTFKRQTPASSDFTISAGTVVSTQPNTGEEQLKFVVKTDTTFKASISGESHNFINGIYNYKLDERFIDSISSLTGTAGGSGYTFVENTDFKLVKNYNGLVFDTTAILTLDDCEATTGWSNSTDAAAIALDNTDYKQGSNSLKLGKSGTASNEASYEKVLSSVQDLSSKNVYLWLYIVDNTALNKISKITITLGSNSSATNSYQLDLSNLSTGWNIYEFDFSSNLLVKNNLANRSAINFLKISIYTNNASDTLTSGDVKMDFWFGGTGESYEGDVIEFLASGTMPDNNTSISVDYTPLSKEVECESEQVGSKNNVGIGKIIYKVSFISNIDSVYNYESFSGGTDIEADDDLRGRIKSATELKGKATVESLKQAVLGIEGVTSVSVDDLPLKSVSNEPHNHISFASTPSAKLDNEVALDNANLVVTGTRGGSSVTFQNGVDYYLQDSTIYWVDDTKDPDDGTTFYVSYDYNWLGHVNMFVSGSTTPLPSNVVSEVNQVIDDTKAAGVVVSWSEPTVVTVNVDAKISVDTANGYDFTTVSQNVEEALTNFLNSKGTGEDVYVAELVDVIMGVEGVTNTQVTNPAADVSIAVSEVAKAGTITITSL